MTMDCTETRSRLHPYLDHELDAPSALAIDRHLASCPSCKAVFAQHAALQAGIREHATYYRAPRALRERIRQQIEPRSPWLRLRQWFPLGAAVAATAVLSWSAAIQYAGLSRDEVLAEQVVAGHARSVVTARLVDVASSDQHTVKPWLSSKLDFSPPVTDLTGVGFPLAGGRVDYVDNRTVAALVYRHRQHVIDLFVWPDPKPGRDRAPQALSRQGYNALRWSEGGMNFWAISDLNPAEMKAFAEAYAAAK
jgi:anti-sigma factor (TIGR02949 family)